MAHTPHTYSTGDTITAALLNQAEQDLAAAQTAADVAAAVTAASTNDRARANHTGTQAASTITGLATVATTGAYTDLTAKPTIPTVGAAGAGAAVALSSTDASVTNSRTPTAHTHPASDLTATGTRDATTFLRGDNTWATPAGGGGGAGLPATVVNKTAAYTAAAGDFVQADATSAGFTVTLPAAPTVGALVAVKKVDASANTLTIAPSGGGTIDGDPTATTTTKMAGAIFEHVGSNVWRIVASMTTTGPAGPTGPTGPQGIQGIQGTAGVGVPVGGTTGQVLAKTSGTDYATGWTTLSGGGGGGSAALPAITVPSGYWGCPPTAGTNNSAVTANTMYAFPFQVSRNLSITALAFQCTTAGTTGSAVHLGIYADSASLPGALIAECASTALGQNTGQQALAFASSVALTAGTTYWLAYVHNTGATTAQFVVQSNATGQEMTFAVYGNGSTPSFAQTGVLQTNITGALPASFGAPSGYSQGRPVIYYKVA